MNRMPSPPDRLPVLGRMLPRALRERVFEPAYYDLLATHTAGEGGGSPLFGLRVFGLALDTLRVGSLRLAWNTFRRSRRLQVAVTVAVVLVVGLLIGTGGSYDGPTPYGP
ncbi:MAG: hypothetical protein ACE5FP_02195 [Gemmatimonadota bacterium]